MKDLIALTYTSYHSFRCLFNRIFLSNTLYTRCQHLHIGCGQIHLKNFLNIDSRATSATDLVMDCSNLSPLPRNFFKTVYAQAFIEHLRLDKRLPFLHSVYGVLSDDGIALFLGIPDFETAAKSYLTKSKGIKHKKFDLWEVYRYTHGDPEQHPGWWYEQLHKSLFDVQEIDKLLKEAGFKYYKIFRYCFAKEKIALNLGFVAFKTKPKSDLTKKRLTKLMSEYRGNVALNTLQIVNA